MAGVEGADRFAATIRHAGALVADTAETDARAGALVVKAARPPRLSGRLAATLGASARPGGGFDLTAATPYAGVIHQGWPAHHIRPQPFYTAAVTVSVDVLETAYADHLGVALSTVEGA